jgi:hypothetical protein
MDHLLFSEVGKHKGFVLKRSSRLSQDSTAVWEARMRYFSNTMITAINARKYSMQILHFDRDVFAYLMRATDLEHIVAKEIYQCPASEPEC